MLREGPAYQFFRHQRFWKCEGRHHALEETQHSLLAADTTKQRSKMAESGRVLPALTWLPEFQERMMVNTCVLLEYRRRFTLVPKPLRVPESEETWARFVDIQKKKKKVAGEVHL